MRWIGSATVLLALVMRGAWLSNAPLGVMASYLLAFAALSAALLRALVGPDFRSLVAVPLGLGLAAIYLVPAAVEQKWVQIHQATDVGMRDRRQLALRASRRLPISNCTIRTLARLHHLPSLMIGVTAVPASSPCAVACSRRESRAFWLPLLILAAGIFLLQLLISAFLWNLLPKLQLSPVSLALADGPGDSAWHLAGCGYPARHARWRIGSTIAWTSILLIFAAGATLFFFPALRCRR